ncbi:S-adenosyl-L-methionine-dependent methyltransferase [Leucosporidium creatinivorum]|uniref:S-adenosyl-L-methionine-dependent methyltransferase n=1 Tax=Leucosporidium creatinivorum TaxID=106004 RepID=A0A1Y2CCA1_9BASI|nr:S-adenosyl-L-methionine-dependent methyltransferase [Leucosporidium creatinivorum]
MAEAKRAKFGKEGEASRFLKVIVEVLKFRPHLQHLLTHSKLLEVEPTLFIAPVWADAAPKVRSAAAVTKELNRKTAKKPRPTPTPISLATVMLHDLLFAKRGLTLPKEHKLRKKLEKYKPALDKENEKEKKRRKVSSNEGLQIPLPENVASAIEGIGKGKKKAHDAEAGEADGVGEVRWLRVNTLKWTVEAAVEWFEEQRWELYENVESMIEAAKEKSKVYALDAHIEPLLALPSTVSLPSLQPFTDGRLIAQDKASCMPAWVLLSEVLAEEYAEQERLANSGKSESFAEADARQERRKKNGVKVLDATAAPGNKTTMAAAMSGEMGKVVAIERDAGRFKVLKSMCQKAGATNVTPMNTDFLSIDPQDIKFKNISHFLVDPSCSGSGIPSRLDHLIPEAPEEEQAQRIRALSNFQVTILSHAMRFTGARRVVYSTCSIWAQEDEGVVMRILAKKEFQEKGWTLAPRDEVLPTWERRGIVEECGGDATIADSLVRCLPEDQSNGFFVACFVRGEPASGDDSVAAIEVDGEAAPELTHAERQEAFKAKSRQKGGKGGPKAPVVKPVKEASAVRAKVEAPKVGVQKKKAAVPGKKAAYLAEKKRKNEERERAGKKAKSE